MLRADVSDPASLRALAENARVVATTVGPYVRYGEELVAACADTGADYLDLTGEPEFVDLTYVRHDARARETGARLLHACGFDSVPHDLGAYFTVRQLPEGVPLTVDGFVTADASFSGGTFASALGQFARGRQMVAAARERGRHEPRLVGRRAAAPVGAPRFAQEVGAWALPLPTVDAQVVLRSARALERYGPGLPLPALRGRTAAAGRGGRRRGASARWSRRPRCRRRGAGCPTGSSRARGRALRSGRAAGSRSGSSARAAAARVYTEVAGGDPGYDETAKMFAESALCPRLRRPAADGRTGHHRGGHGGRADGAATRAGIRFRVAARR